MKVVSFLICFLSASILGRSLRAQSMDTLSPSAPTNFSSNLDFSESNNLSENLSDTSGVHLRNSGGEGKMQTLSIRGSNPSDIAVSLEGIRLNTPSFGAYDFGNLSSFGLEEGKIIHGGYSPFSSSPGGEVLLRLPRENIYRFHLDRGSYDETSVAFQTPFSTFTLDQSDNDFPYEDQGQTKTRLHNASQRMNLRAWKRGENGQIWTQIVFSDQELPGPSNFLSPGETETIIPTLAFQGKWKNNEWAVWGIYERQTYTDNPSQNHSLNRSWSSGYRDQGRYQWASWAQFETTFEWTQDKLFSKQANPDSEFESPLRQTLSLSLASYIDLTDRWLLHPQLRSEFISDLDEEHFSVHQGLGSRYRVTEWLDLLGNISYVSRAPNFYEMYYQVAGLDLNNPSLRRQRSLQGDFGYQIQTKILNSLALRFEQAAFVDRTERLLQTVPLPGGTSGTIYQVQNLGNSVTTGLETEASLQLERFFRINGQYTLQSSKVADHTRDYQPTHRLTLQPCLFPDEWMSFYIPLYMRSSVPVVTEQIGPQWDLGLIWIMRSKFFEYRIQFSNLLGWNREEIKNFPLSNEPSVRVSLNTTF